MGLNHKISYFIFYSGLKRSIRIFNQESFVSWNVSRFAFSISLFQYNCYPWCTNLTSWLPTETTGIGKRTSQTECWWRSFIFFSLYDALSLLNTNARERWTWQMFPKWQTSQAWIFTAVIVLLNLRNVLRFGPTPANGYIPVFSVALCKFLLDAYRTYAIVFLCISNVKRPVASSQVRVQILRK